MTFSCTTFSCDLSLLSRDTMGQRATLWVPASTHLVVEVNVSHCTNALLFLLCSTTVNMCVLVSPIFAMSQNIYSGLSEANYYRCLSVCNGGCYWSDLLKNIAMLRNKHKKTQRMLFTDTTERKKKGWSRFGVPCSSTHSMRGKAHSMFLSLLLPHATQEVTQCSPSPSATEPESQSSCQAQVFCQPPASATRVFT